MAREIDRRDYTVNRATPARESELHSVAATLSDDLPGMHRIRIERFDATTGNPSLIISEAAPAERGDYVQRALAHVQGISRALGLTATQATDYVADPLVQQTSSNAAAVHLQQQYQGIPIFQAAETVRFGPDGAIKETVGSSITVPQAVTVDPKLSVQQAVLRAAEHVATPQPDEQGSPDPFGQPRSLPSIDLTGFEPKVMATFPEKPDRPTVLEAGPFEESIKARLVWFPLEGPLRLTWEVILSFPNYTEQYRTLVDVENGEILYCRQLSQSVAAQGNVYMVDGGSARQMTNFPKALADYGLPLPGNLPPGFPDDWVAATNTSGNCVHAHLGSTGSAGQGVVQGGTLTFNPADPTGDAQKILNIFYYNCFMHDFFYLLGFKEIDGNFQSDNFGRGGLPSDRVDARAHSGVVDGTANMATPADGSAPVMNMGLVIINQGLQRHTAFDSSVVYHEFVHGVTNRLVGGPVNAFALEAHQSGGMGEGWSDYFACTINDTIVIGNWVTNNPGGIRGFPYNSNFPDNFGDLGSGRYSGFLPNGRRWPHPIGEIWCATLLEMNRNIGKLLGAQLVVDALKLTPANPSFLDARDAILAALEDKLAAGQLSANEHQAAWQGIWAAFAKFGMGPAAQSNGASLSGIVADFNLPAPPQPGGADVQLETAPNLAIPDDQPAGVTSVLTVSQVGRITRLTVSVDISHPYRGDLQVSLIPPGGAPLVLHNRQGSSADNLVASYRSEDIPALAALLGEQAQGDWTLQVADLAARDLGTLQRWGLEMDFEVSSQGVGGETSPGVAIPDDDPNGVSSSLNIAQAGAAQGLVVSLDITHTFIGDLQVELITPSGQQAILHNQTGGGQDNLIRNYDSVSSPTLAALIGQPIQGAWTLRVRDLVGLDTGKLNKWGITLTL